MTQLQQDLEALLATCTDNWCGNGADTPSTMIGRGGCLLSGMKRVLVPQLLPSEEEGRRTQAMVVALGFNVSEHGWYSDMYRWNDHHATHDMVLERIKDALNNQEARP